jgi:hypothetical protein
MRIKKVRADGSLTGTTRRMGISSGRVRHRIEAHADPAALIDAREEALRDLKVDAQRPIGHELEHLVAGDDPFAGLGTFFADDSSEGGLNDVPAQPLLDPAQLGASQIQIRLVRPYLGASRLDLGFGDTARLHQPLGVPQPASGICEFLAGLHLRGLGRLGVELRQGFIETQQDRTGLNPVTRVDQDLADQPCDLRGQSRDLLRGHRADDRHLLDHSPFFRDRDDDGHGTIRSHAPYRHHGKRCRGSKATNPALG